MLNNKRKCVIHEINIYIFLPAAAFATNEMESDMDKDRRGRFLKNFFLDYISKKQQPFFFSARL